jgi:tRNA(Glu) U13 pseudouridine synthase TruD
MNLNPKRLDGETFNDYKDRRKAGNKTVKARLLGRPVKHTKKESKEIVKEEIKARRDYYGGRRFSL